MSTYRIKGSDGVVIESDKFLQLPIAPTKSTADVQRAGMIRYNNGWKSFEGTLEFTDGSIEYRRFANLDDNGRLQSSQLPDSVTSGMKYIGTFSPISDDVDPPVVASQYDNLPQASTANSGNYFIVRGIYDAAVAHFKANNPSTSPVTFTPTNPSGQGNWIQVKYYFSADPYDSSRKTITHSFGRIISASIPSTGHLGLKDLAGDVDLTKAFDSGNNPSSETALTDTDWVISDATKWTRQRQSRTSILAGAVMFDRTQMYSTNRLLADSPTGTVQNVVDSVLMYNLRRTGDAMYDAGTPGAGRLAFVYGTAVAPSITFNSNTFDSVNNPGIDPSKWSDNTTGIYHPNVAGGIGFTSSGTERLRIVPTQVIFYPNTSGTASTPSIVFSASGNTNLGILALNNKLQLVSNNTVNVSFENGLTNFYGSTNITGNSSVLGNTTLGDAATDTLTVNATSTFNAPVSMKDVTMINLTVTGNTILGDASSDTLTVNAASTFASTSRFNALSTFNNGITLANGSAFTFGGTNNAVVTKASTALNFNMSAFDDVTILDGSTVRTKINRYGVKIPVLSPTVDTVGEDGMIAFSSDQKTVVQKVDGTWKPVGSGATIVNFLTSTWVLSGSYYQLSYTGSGIKDVTVQLQETDGSFSQVVVDSVNITSTGATVKIPSSPGDMRFAGRMLVVF